MARVCGGHESAAVVPARERLAAVSYLRGPYREPSLADGRKALYGSDTSKKIKTCLYSQAMADTAANLVQRLRSAAEPTRLRLLAVLAGGEFSVGELTEILGQSQPRVSRHLKLLCDAGLLERFREQHWIYYRVPSDGPGSKFVSNLLAALDQADTSMHADRERVARVLEARRNPASGRAQSSVSDPVVTDELARAIRADLGNDSGISLLYAGVVPGALLTRLAPNVRRVVGVHRSRDELQRARAQLHTEGLGQCVLQHAEIASLPFPAAAFDCVVLDRVVAAESNPARAIREAARVLVPGGRLILVEDFDALVGGAGGANPLATVRGWLSDGGCVCRRLRPLDAGPAHLLLAVAGVDRIRVAA
jgi:DNA-binding transcriptional ArsR family regulator